jgi:hypothetical protein
MPTDTTKGFVKITNDGNIAADFTLTMQAPVDKLGTAVVPALSLSAGEGIAKLSDTLDLVVNDGTTDIYTGKLKNFAPLSVGNFAAGASKTFEFTVTFPDTDVGGVKGADNKYKGSETTVEFDWEAIGS